MPELVAFTQEEPELIVKSEDGLVRVGKVGAKSPYKFVYIGLVAAIIQVGGILVTKQNLAVFLLICAAFVIIAIIDQQLPTRLFLTLDAGGKMEIPLNRALRRNLRTMHTQADPLKFRPSVVANGETLVELRSDWRDSGWEVYIPATIASENVLEHLRAHLPSLENAITLSS